MSSDLEMAEKVIPEVRRKLSLEELLEKSDADLSYYLEHQNCKKKWTFLSIYKCSYSYFKLSTDHKDAKEVSSRPKIKF